MDQNQLEFHWNYLNSLANTVIGKHMNGKNNKKTAAAQINMNQWEMHCRKIAIDLLAIKELQNIHMKLHIRIKTYTEQWRNNRQT